MENMEDEISLLHRALLSCPVGDPSRSKRLHQLARASNVRFQECRDVKYLDDAITYDREAVATCAQDDINRADYMLSLANSLNYRYEIFNRIEDPDEAIRHCREATATRDTTYHIAFTNALATAFSHRFHHLHRAEDVNQAISLYCQGLDSKPTEYQRLMFLINLAVIRKDAFDQLHRVEYLEESVACSREAVHLSASNPDHHTIALSTLAAGLYESYLEKVRQEDLDEAIERFHEVIRIYRFNDFKKSQYLSTLATALMRRFERLASPNDVAEALEYYRQALSLLPLDHQKRAACFYELAECLKVQFTLDGTASDLEQALFCHREALALRSPPHSDRLQSLVSLGDALHIVSDGQKNAAALNEAIPLMREALSICSRDHPFRSRALCSLATALTSQFILSANPVDIDESISLLREALELTTDGPYLYKFSMDLSTALLERYMTQGEEKDLHETVDYSRAALEICPSSHPHYGVVSMNHANGLYSLFLRTGQMEDLEEANIQYRQALEILPTTHYLRWLALVSFSAAKMTLFHRLGRVGDIEESIKLLRQALKLCPPGHGGRGSCLTNLGAALKRRYDASREEADLEKAIKHGREAVSLFTTNDSLRPTALDRLASALAARFERHRRTEDLEEALNCMREAVDLAPPHSLWRTAYMNDLAVTLTARYNSATEPNGREAIQDLDEAIRYHTRTLDLRADGHPDRVESLNSLANLLIIRYDLLGTNADLEHALQVLQEAVNDRSGNPRMQFQAAERWASIARAHGDPSASSAYSTALFLLERCLILFPIVDYQQQFLASSLLSITADAASYAIEQGSLKTAVEILEQGRGMLWTRMRGYRHPSTSLRAVDERLAVELDDICAEINHITTSRESLYIVRMVPTAEEDAMWARYRVLLSQFDDVVARIRRIEGFQSFLKAESFGQLRVAATEGPVIMVNVNRHRSDALILHSVPPDEVVIVSLSKSVPEELMDSYQDFLSSRTLRGADFSGKMSVVLRKLWRLVARPIVSELEQLGVKHHSRIWWCPTSTLCAFPVHAAGPYIQGKENLPDIYVSSYTPSLSSLIRARTDIAEGRVPSLLVVGSSDSDQPLPMVEKEIAILEGLGTELRISIDSLVKTDVSPNNVLRSLRDHSWIHFACHGLLDSARPFDSSFKLHDSELALRDIIRAELPNAELAFLAACHSAANPDNQTPDEVIHLAAAVQFSGFRSVVGTMWEMSDNDGPTLARLFYSHMRSATGDHIDFRDSARALHAAVQTMTQNADSETSDSGVRGMKPVNSAVEGSTVYRWITFIHIGA